MEKLVLHIVFLFVYCSCEAQYEPSLLSKEIQEKPVYYLYTQKRFEELNKDTNFFNSYIRNKKNPSYKARILNFEKEKPDDVYRIKVEPISHSCNDNDSLTVNLEDYINLAELNLIQLPYFPKGIEKLKNLKVLLLGNFFCEGCCNKTSKSSYYPFPTNELLNLSNLNELYINAGHALIYIPEKLIYTHKSLKKIIVHNECFEPVFECNTVTYFPVPFSIINSKVIFFNYLYGINYPELANLVYQKKAIDDNKLPNYNLDFLISLVNEKNLPIWYPGKKGTRRPYRPRVKKNGKYINYYLNKNKMVVGNFVNGKPDGEWTFWYADKKICEKRFYNNGVEDKSWIFYTETGDTAQVLNFDNGKLLSAYKKVEHKEGNSNKWYRKAYMNFETGEYWVFASEEEKGYEGRELKKYLRSGVFDHIEINTYSDKQHNISLEEPVIIIENGIYRLKNRIK